MMLHLIQIPAVVPIVTDGKATTLATISVGLFVWSSISNFLQNKEMKANNKAHEDMVRSLASITSYAVDILHKSKELQTWQKESWNKLEEVKKIEIDTIDDLKSVADKLSSIGHQIELVAQNQLAATNGLQQVINRMLDIIKDATKES